MTEKTVEIADSCNLCGDCDYQCYFVTEMRPSRVMQALKDHVDSFLRAGGRPESPAEDDRLREIREIVGEEWATNDRAIALTYSHDPCPVAAPRMPAYVVLPGSRAEISALLRLFRKHRIAWVARGNGAMTMPTFSLRCVASIEVAVEEFGLGSMHHLIEVLDVGKLLALIGPESFDQNCKNMDVAVDSRGRVYVADTARLWILVFEPEDSSPPSQPAACWKCRD